MSLPALKPQALPVLTALAHAEQHRVFELAAGEAHVLSFHRQRA